MPARPSTASPTACSCISPQPKAWNTPPRFGEFFAESFSSTRSLISSHEGIWRWCLQEGSAAWPRKLPPYLQTSLIGFAALTIDDDPWELRASLVRANGEPWIDLDAHGMPIPETGSTVIDWPYPEPGPGMFADDPADEFQWPTFDIEDVPSELLSLSDVPSATATWSEISFFATHLNGYERFGDRLVGEMANTARQYFDDYLRIDPSLNLDQLRGCLFFEYRRFHHFSHAPGADDTPYIRSLVEAIRAKVDVTR